MLKNYDNFTSLRTPGIKGLNYFNDSSAIEDAEMADATNMWFEQGFVGPREGSSVLYSKPGDETADPLQIEKVQTSDGIEYVIAIYGNSFYVRHETNGEWIKINQNYSPSETDKFYGNTVWNNGRGDDRWYACNGVDNFLRWDLCVDTADGSYSSGGSSITLNDGTRFPNTGTLIINSDNGIITEEYTSRSTNQFTLSNTLDEDVSDGASVVLMAEEKSGMELGKHVSKFQKRLVVSNYRGGETVIWFSKQTEPENFTVGANVEDATTEAIADGNGEITGVHDFGQFIVAAKNDSMHSVKFQLANDLNSKLSVIQPIVSGQSMGPLDSGSTEKIMNTLYYPTETNGFLSLFPSNTGNDLSVESNTLSQKIDNLIEDELDLSNTRSASSNNKIMWAVSREGAQQNTIVLMYDMLRQAWTKLSGFAIQDFTVKDDEFLFLDYSTGEVTQIFDGSYNDNNEPYEQEFYLKRFDYESMAMPKTQDTLYIQGYMTPASEFYIDILFNENGVLDKQTYKITKDTEGLYYSDPITDASGSFIRGNPILGAVRFSEIGELSVFRCYLALATDNGFYNIQPRFYSQKEAFWGITGIAFNPTSMGTIPQEFQVQPVN